MNRRFQLLWSAAMVALFLSGCATRDSNPAQPGAGKGYVDFYTTDSEGLNWDVARFDPGAQTFQTVYSELNVPPVEVLRLRFTPGHHRLRITFLNRVVTKPVEVEVEVADRKITPVNVTLSEAGAVQVRTQQQNRGGSAAYGRQGWRTKIGSDEAMSYNLSATAGAPTAYQTKELMSYAR